MAKVWKKLQRADGDFQGTWDGVQKSNVYHTANKPDKDDVGLGNIDNAKFDSNGKFKGELIKSDGTSVFDPSDGNFTGTFGSKAISDFYRTDNKPTKSDVGLANVDNSLFGSSGEFKGKLQKSDGTDIFDPADGNFTGKIGGTAASTVEARAKDAKDAVDGNANISMVGGSIFLGTVDANTGKYPFAVNSSGDLKIKEDEFQALSDGTVNCKGNFTIKQDANGDSKIILEGDNSGTALVEVNGANPHFNLGGSSPLGTATLDLKRTGTGNQSRIFFYTGSTKVGCIGFANQPSAYNDQFAIHTEAIYDNSSPYKERALSFDADGKMGMYANTKTVAGFTFGTDGTNKHVYIKDGSLGINTTPSDSYKLDIDNGVARINRGNSSGNIAEFRGLNANRFIVSTDGIDVTGNADISGDLDVGTDTTFQGDVQFDGSTSGISYDDLEDKPSSTTYSAGTGLSLSTNTFSIANKGVDTAQLANSAVETAQINADAVTNAKIADDAVDTEHIAAAAIGVSEMNLPQGNTGDILIKNSYQSGGMSWNSTYRIDNLFQFSARLYTRYNYWYYPSTTYGINSHTWSSTLSSTSVASSWAVGYSGFIYVPYACTLTECYFVGDVSATETYVIQLLKGTPSYPTSTATSLTAISVHSGSVTTGQRVRLGSDSLSTSLAKGDILVPAFRKTTNPSSGTYRFLDGQFVINIKKS